MEIFSSDKLNDVSSTKESSVIVPPAAINSAKLKALGMVSKQSKTIFSGAIIWGN